MEELPNDELDARFRALADHNRRTMILMVTERPGITLQEVSAAFPISRFAVMSHINILEKAGILRSEKESIYRHFFPVAGSMSALFDAWMSRVERIREKTERDWSVGGPAKEEE